MIQLSLFTAKIKDKTKDPIKVHAYRKNKSFKVWYFVPDGEDLVNRAIAEGRRLNKDNQYYASEKMRTIKVKDKIYNL